jgi:prepilin-type N-terminal cleavage/methylation domain-containing protein
VTKERSGVTLIELMVVLVLLSVLASVVVFAIRSTPRAQPHDQANSQVLAARDSALRTGHFVTVDVDVAGSQRVATAFPDGRVIADTALHFDELSGLPSHASH